MKNKDVAVSDYGQYLKPTRESLDWEIEYFHHFSLKK